MVTAQIPHFWDGHLWTCMRCGFTGPDPCTCRCHLDGLECLRCSPPVHVEPGGMKAHMDAVHRRLPDEGACWPGCDYEVTGYHARRGGRVLCGGHVPGDFDEEDKWVRDTKAGGVAVPPFSARDDLPTGTDTDPPWASLATVAGVLIGAALASAGWWGVWKMIERKVERARATR